MTFRRIYMDNNATTPLHPKVKDAMKEAMGLFGNPSSLHSYGRMVRSRVEEAREVVASFIGAEPDEIIFTGSGSEANNTVLSLTACQSNLCDLGEGTGAEVITTTIEHPCVLETARCLQNRSRRISFVDVDRNGKINIEQLQNMLSKETHIVSVMMANNEIGTIQDIKKITGIVHKAGAFFHTDAVQAVGKIPVNVRELDIDFLTFSAHKIYGPKGIGVLYVKKGVPFCPLIRGGHQERGRRAGTENTLGIFGFRAAIEMRSKEMEKEAAYLKELKTLLKQGIEAHIPDVQFNGHPVDCLPNTLSVSFDGAEGEAILLYLDLEGIAVSTGSACASGSLDPSHVLLATGIPAERAHGSIRLSMGRETTRKDIEYVIDRLPKVIRKIRGMSTAYQRRPA